MIATIRAKYMAGAKCAYRTCNKDVLTRRLEYRHGTCQYTIPWYPDIPQE
jgi:hypothetical protein